PHPGNFAFREDGSVIVYDYGGVKTLSTEVIGHFRELIHAAREKNIPVIEQQMDALHSLTETGKFPKELYEQWLEVIMRPLVTDYYFAENSAHHDRMELLKPSLKYRDVFKHSHDTFMVNSTISGKNWNLIHLKVPDV